jgi:hypothetical protein
MLNAQLQDAQVTRGANNSPNVVSGDAKQLQKLMEENVFVYFDASTHASLLTADLRRFLCASKINAYVPLSPKRRNAPTTIILE